MNLLLRLSCAAVLAATTVAAAPPPGPPAKPISAADKALFRQGFERGLAKGSGAVLFASIKKNFPAEYSAMLDVAAERASQHLGDEAALRQIGFDAIRTLFLAKLPDVVNAPAPLLVELNRRQLAFVRHLSTENPSACAEYVTTGLTAQRRLSPERETEAASISAHLFDSARAGADRARDPSRSGLDQDAGKAWYDRLQALEPAPEIQALLTDPKLQATATAEQKCRLGLAIFGAVDALPEEQAANVAAFFLAESARTAAN